MHAAKVALLLSLLTLTGCEPLCAPYIAQVFRPYEPPRQP